MYIVACGRRPNSKMTSQIPCPCYTHMPCNLFSLTVEGLSIISVTTMMRLCYITKTEGFQTCN